MAYIPTSGPRSMMLPMPFEGGMPRRNPKLPYAPPRPRNNYQLLEFLRRGRNVRGIRQF